ncbi:uncharacterized protein EAE98_000232 [Botrytis deweyae]|uniref:Heterokaryon incompatibility domain-containing protein n=1 Tax=Botrytis deweyae TaxID=2478750 RepID=A0ABQ7J250_9HELO|nr:uncharacterized protein EAE98_000232 [Botrytis deweyae]KAF7940105.1 hypothetical protein EAE98_000232 [Botrytis deweyae]
MLCTVCDRLNVTDLLKQAKANSGKSRDSYDYLVFEHHKRYDDLVTAASSGCELCLLLQRQCEEEEVEIDYDGTLSTREQSFRNIEAGNKPLDLRVEIEASHLYSQEFQRAKVFDHLTFKQRHDDGYYNSYTVMICILQTPKDQPKFIDDTRIGQFIIDEDLASDANFDIARGWMNTCIAEHSESKCPSVEDEVLPSRVIDVGSEDANPSLFVANGLRGKYTALSHCWGGEIETILTKSNLQSLQKEIKMTSLPANFRDAILITRGLGFQYLWIDSLCIIQDSIHDWSTESTKMGDIYRNSVLTIGAAAAHKAADGILHTRSPKSRDLKPKLKLSKDSGSDDIVEIASSILRREDLAGLMRYGPLQSRAWALQERILSPRILWYGRRQIYWQCQCGFQSADGTPSSGRGFPSSESYIYPIITQSLIFNQNYNDKFTIISEEELLEMNREYHFMVEDYCNRNLSDPNDKLPAFAGIAALLHKGVGGHYLAGIWSKYFRENLLWKTLTRKSRRTMQYRAPSWSWAVMNEGDIHYDKPLRLASTLYDPILSSHHIELSSANPYGAVRYAHIIVDALTLKLIHLGQYRNPANEIEFCLRVESSGDDDFSFYVPRTILEEGVEIKIPGVGVKASIDAKPIHKHPRLEIFRHYYWDEKAPDWSAVSPLKYKVMLVGLRPLPSNSRGRISMLGSITTLKCLILQEDPEDAKLCRRVGQMALFDFYTDTTKPDWDAWLASDWWERETLKLI